VFQSALAADNPLFTVLYVHGTGGVGKTTLLREFARLAQTVIAQGWRASVRQEYPAWPL